MEPVLNRYPTCARVHQEIGGYQTKHEGECATTQYLVEPEDEMRI